MTCQAGRFCAMLPRDMKRSVVALVVGLAGWAAGQALDGGDSLQMSLPPAPASQVLDEAGLFSREPARLEAISRRLTELEKNHGWPVYVAIYSGLLGITPEEQALALRAAWTKVAGEGLVIVYESDTRLVAFGRPLEAPVAADGSGQRFGGRVPAYVLDEMLSRVVKEAQAKAPRLEQVETLACGIADELEAALTQGQESSFTGERLRFVLIVVGGICVISLLALVGSRVISRSDKQRRRVHRLPDVTVGIRLGAPFGGGRVIARAYRGNRGTARGTTDPASAGGAS